MEIQKNQLHKQSHLQSKPGDRRKKKPQEQIEDHLFKKQHEIYISPIAK